MVKSAVFWDVAPYSSCVNRRFGGTHHLHLRDRKMRERGTSVSRWLRIFLPWRWRWCVPPNCQFTQELNGVTSQKMAFFIVTAMKISNLTIYTVFNLWRYKCHNSLVTEQGLSEKLDWFKVARKRPVASPTAIFPTHLEICEIMSETWYNMAN
jgi:hypothetical protein